MGLFDKTVKICVTNPSNKSEDANIWRFLGNGVTSTRKLHFRAKIVRLRVFDQLQNCR